MTYDRLNKLVRDADLALIKLIEYAVGSKYDVDFQKLWKKANELTGDIYREGTKRGTESGSLK